MSQVWTQPNRQKTRLQFEPRVTDFVGDDDESRGIKNNSSGISDELVHEVDEFLARHEVESSVELEHLAQKLDTAIAINNDPRAREMRKALKEKYGKNDVR